MKLRSWLRSASLVCVAVALGACQSGDTDYNAVLALDPVKPVVINTPFERLTGEVDDQGNPITETVAASWFLAKYQVTNNGSSTITVVSITVNLNLPAPVDGSSVEGGKGTCTLEANEDELGRTYLLEVGPGETKSIGYYCSALSFPEGAGFAASGTMQLNGWIGDHKAPVQRLNTKPFSFSTQ